MSRSVVAVVCSYNFDDRIYVDVHHPRLALSEFHTQSNTGTPPQQTFYNSSFVDSCHLNRPACVEGNCPCSLASGWVNRDSSSVVHVTHTLWGLDVLPNREPRRVQQIVARKPPPAAPARRIGVGQKLPGVSPDCSSESAALQFGSALSTCSGALDDMPGCHCPRQRP